MLGELEQLILLAILRDGPESYGVSIQDTLIRATGRDVLLATIHKVLSRMEAKGLVRSEMGEPLPERGGRRRRLFTVTMAGKKEVRASLRAIDRLSRGLDVSPEAS